MPSTSVRRAVESDIEEIVRLRGVMYVALEMDIEGTDWRSPSRKALRQGLESGIMIGGVIDNAATGGLCAAGILTTHRGLASPRFPRGTWGHIGSVAVDVEHRRQGLGEQLMTFLIAIGREMDVERLELHATNDGEPLYRRLGFETRVGGVELRMPLQASNRNDSSTLCDD